jgi:hypothetical protein
VTINFLDNTSSTGPVYSVAPDTNSDRTKGFGPGFVWIQNASGTVTVFVCVSAERAAAVWQKLANATS